MTTMFYDWLNDLAADAAARVKSGLDTTADAAQAALEAAGVGIAIFLLTLLLAHAAPLIFLWLVGAPFWFVAMKAFGL